MYNVVMSVTAGLTNISRVLLMDALSGQGYPAVSYKKRELKWRKVTVR